MVDTLGVRVKSQMPCGSVMTDALVVDFFARCAHYRDINFVALVDEIKSDGGDGQEDAMPRTHGEGWG